MDNRKVVVAYFETPRMVFKIPKGVDLEDKTIIKSYDFENFDLVIYYTNGTIEHIDCAYADDYMGVCDSLEIRDAEDYPVEYSSEEE
tara:strand:+ start:1650 stop:1910 length:261 start_codon:yes stop_codon:yes gene_type:complete